MGEMMDHYHIGLVTLSVLVAVLSSYVSLEIARRLLGGKGGDRFLWLVLGGLSLGGGIWSMHFVAMLAYEMDMMITYDPLMLFTSILLAILSSGFAFYIISKKTDQKRLLSAAVLIGSGIVAMHYVGMEAMRMEASIRYDVEIVILSIAIAFLVSYVALRLFLSYSLLSGGKWRLWISAIIMGAAISGMHYTGMASATFINHSGMATDDPAPLVEPTTLAYLVAIGIFTIIGFTILLVRYETRIEDSDHRLDVLDRMQRTIIESANDAVITADEKGMVLTWNKAAETIFGYTSKDVIGESLQKIIPHEFRQAHQAGIERYTRTNERKVIGRTVELQGLHQSGNTFPIELSLSTFRDGDDTYFTGIIRDITERFEHQQRIKELVYRDDLTNLPNRRMLTDHLASCIEQAKTDAQIIAVMFLDLDRFKQINDVYGHGAGDMVLKATAERVQSCLSSKDFLARQSGDEFVVVLPQSNHFQAGNIAKQVLEEISKPFLFNREELYISTSIGISLYPDDGPSAGTLLKHADTAMYEAKKEGGNQYSYFTQEFNELISRKMTLETGLRRALERSELELYYQPQVEARTEKIVGFEALVRWNHPDLGIISPVEFIPLAEETSLIVPMGEWILGEACRRFRKWLDVKPDLKHVSVNISALQFRQPHFSDIVKRTLEETDLEPWNLELELTETIIQEPERALPIMHELKKMGVKLSLDDFGTGYSSLSYLKDFPLDTLKIDKSFTRAIHENLKDKAVVETIVHMAEKLGLNVIAEGVETPEQLACILESNCNEFQGYLCSPPLPNAAITEKFITPKLFETS